MLVLTRKPGESIIINEDIEIVILPPNVYGTSQVRMGFKAPPSVKIYRKELLERILNEHISNRGNYYDR